MLIFKLCHQIKDPSGISYYPTTLADWSMALWHPMSYDVTNTTAPAILAMKVPNGGQTALSIMLRVVLELTSAGFYQPHSTSFCLLLPQESKQFVSFRYFWKDFKDKYAYVSECH